MFQAVPPPIIRSTKLYIQRQILSNHYCCPLLSSMRWNSMEFHCGCDGTPLSSITYSAHHQEHKTVHTASGIVKPILLAAVIVNEMELHGIPLWMRWNPIEFHHILRPSSGAQNCTYSVRYCQTNTSGRCYRG